MEDWVFRIAGIERRAADETEAGRVRLSCHATYCSWGNLELDGEAPRGGG